MRSTKRGPQARGRHTSLGLILVAAGVGLACGGCGGDEAVDGRVPSMVALPDAAGGQGAAPSAPPAIEKIAIQPRRPVPGARLTASVVLAGNRAAGVEVAYQWYSGGGRLLGEGPVLESNELEAGSTIEVVARATANGQRGEAFRHRFRLVDRAKEIGLVAIEAREGKTVGSILTAAVETSEANAGFADAEYEWRVAGKLVGSEEELDTASLQPGDVVELAARLQGEEGDTLRANPIVLERGAPPVIHSQPTAGIEGGRFRYAVEASSPARGARLRYALEKGPEGMKIDADSGVVSWRPLSGQVGRFEVELTVEDQWGSGVAQSFWIQSEPQLASEALR